MREGSEDCWSYWPAECSQNPVQKGATQGLQKVLLGERPNCPSQGVHDQISLRKAHLT